MEEKLIAKLIQAHSGGIYDVMRDLGYANCVLSQKIRPLNLDHKIFGKIYTIEGKTDKSLDKHTSLLNWCKMLSSVPEESVLICQPHDCSVAHMGELSAEALTLKNVKGYIVNGGCRDSAFIEKLNFPVFCKYYTPKDVVAAWTMINCGGIIEMEGVRIRTNDYAFADRDGIVIIPREIITKVANEVAKVLKTENKVRKAIIQGADPVDAYLKYGKF